MGSGLFEHCMWYLAVQINMTWLALFYARSSLSLHHVPRAVSNRSFLHLIHFRDASLQYNFSHIFAQQFIFSSPLWALVCSLRAQYACCFDADSVLTQTKRDRRTNSVWQQPLSLADIRHGTLYWGENECCDKVNRTEWEWDFMGLIV